MKRRDMKDLQNKAIDELKKMLKDSRQAVTDMRIDMKIGKVKNTRSLFMKRKEVAYILTQLRRKEMQRA